MSKETIEGKTFVKMNDKDCAEYSIPEGVEVIGKKAFYDCKKLTIVHLPDSVIAIEPHAFERCYDLKDINLPNGIQVIPEDAFHDCLALRKITLPDTLLEIKDSAFESCIELQEAIIPSSVCYIRSKAFFCCTELRKTGIKWDSDKTQFHMTIAPDAFLGCSKLEGKKKKEEIEEKEKGLKKVDAKKSAKAAHLL